MVSFEMVEADRNKVTGGPHQLVWEIIEVKLLDGSHKSPDISLMMRAESG